MKEMRTKYFLLTFLKPMFHLLIQLDPELEWEELLIKTIVTTNSNTINDFVRFVGNRPYLVRQSVDCYTKCYARHIIPTALGSDISSAKDQVSESLLSAIKV